ncbi:hypothetical protein [Paenibacillus sp. YIM B09110]|uniref:hypothetical protein n=1 Tax=Paenibacillus sp. YIM B09110 TaxID=3126102 RepID=UPI00301CDBC9
MEKVKVLSSYIMEGYTLFKVKPLGLIEYGIKKDIYCFDYASLADQWGISMEVLDKVASYDITFSDSMYVSFNETESGLVRTYMMNANATPNLLRKLKDSTFKPNRDIIREFAVIAMLVDKARGYKNG